MTLVAGIDSSTQTCKVTVRDLKTGVTVREGKASHPPETIVDPDVWWSALLKAVERAGGLDDVSAISVSGQQHTPIFLDVTGTPTADSPLWNDMGSHDAMMTLNAELAAMSGSVVRACPSRFPTPHPSCAGYATPTPTQHTAPPRSRLCTIG